MVEDKIKALLTDWLKQHQRGHDVPAAELCKDCPELTEELKRRIDVLFRKIKLMDSQKGRAAAHTSMRSSPAAVLDSTDKKPANETHHSRPAEAAKWDSPEGYDILGELGRGGMGVVYKARQKSLRRVVALKMILGGGHASVSDLERFRTEAESIARLQHPHIVQIYEVGEHQGLPYFSLEFCSGGSLAKKLARTPLEPKAAAALVEPLARAMHAAHEKGVIHRDLKPANVLLTENAAPKITDFGLAKKLDEASQTQSGSVMGSPSYMSPEQAEGKTKEVGPASDIYALGAILYETLTGRAPFKAATMHDTLMQVIRQEPVPPARLNTKVPRDLETICLACLHKEAAKRYGTALALADDLKRFQQGEPIQARPVGRIERGVKWVRRHPAIAALLLAVVMVSGLGLAAFVWAFDQALEARDQAIAEKNQTEQARRQAEEEKQNADKRGQELYHNLYIGEMNLARQAADSLGGLSRARDLSTKWQNSKPDVRGWEWYYLQRQCQTERLTLPGHASVTTYVTWSADGSRLYCSTEDKAPLVWDPSSGKQILAGPKRAPIPRFTAWSPDGARLATAEIDKSVKVWDSAGKKLLVTLPGHSEPAASISWSPDGHYLAAYGTEGNVKVWDVEKGNELWAYHVPTYRAIVAWAPDSKRLACTCPQSPIVIWELETGKVRQIYGAALLKGLAWSPDGTRIAAAAEDASVRIIEAESGKVLVQMGGHQGGVNAVAWSADGKWVASGSRFDWTVRLWNASSGQQAAVFRGHGGPVMSVAFNPRGSEIASASSEGTVKLWTYPVQDRTVSWNHADAQVVSVSWNGDGKRIATSTSNGVINVWDVDKAVLLRNLGSHNAWAWGVAWSPDKETLASGDGAGAVILWDAAQGKQLRKLDNKIEVRDVAWSPTGDRLAVAATGAGVIIWNSAKGTMLATVEQNEASTVAWSGDGTRLASGSWDTSVKLWDAASGKEVHTFLGHGAGVRRVRFSADGSRLVSCGDDGTVRIWDTQSGKALFTLRGHTSAVYHAAFSPDGSRIASASWDKTVKIWDTTTGAEILTIRDYAAPLSTLAWSPDGTRLVACEGWGRMLIHDGRP